MKDKKSISPPPLADKLLRWYCRHTMIEDLEGDLEELFYLNLKHMSPGRAKRRYWKQVLSLIFSYAIKKRKQSSSIHTFSSTTYHPAMIKNYLLIASRNLMRHKFFTVINVLGLAVGMSISLLLIAMLAFLWRYDDFHTNKKNIYRVITGVDDLNQKTRMASAPAGLAEKLTDHYTGIEKVVRINAGLSGEAIHEEKQIPLQGYFVDPEFMEVFTFPLTKGNATTALDKPNNLLITEAAATKMFGATDPIGKVISIGSFGDFQITGVLANVPKNSHMQFEVLGSYQTLIALQRAMEIHPDKTWREFNHSYVYLTLPQGGKAKRVEQFLASIAKEVYAKEKKFNATFELQALSYIAPGEELHDQIGPSWDYLSLAIFGFLTLMILLPACFNYANISISRALKRMKEIGLRKVMGGQKDQIFFQFITETVVIALISLILSFGIFQVVRKEFLMLLVGNDALELNPDTTTIIYFILFAVFVGLIAGLVPALYFSKLTPIEALKTKPAKRGLGNFTFRKILVVSQFALSLGFIMGVVIVMNQYRYTMNFDVGFQQENILDVQLQKTNPEIFKSEFSKLASVQSVSLSSHVLGTAVSESLWVNEPEQIDSVEVYQMFVDETFIPNLELTLISGKNFPAGSDAAKYVIVNEEFLKAFQIAAPAASLGRAFLLPDDELVTVIGVVKNFHYTHLMEPVRSFFFRYDPKEFQVANVRMASRDVFSALTEMEAAWNTFEPEKKFEARFFEDEIEETYSLYFSMIKICGFLGFLAISISCLGLLGMVVFTVENRLKEIGIRKVMGATEMNVTVLLSKHFIKLMLVAAVIAVPFTWVFFEKSFLQFQHYKIEIGIFEIGVSILLMMALGLATILSQTIRAARANPVDTLRSE
jgi:ABC-type antimicrobial peptide transport system permease subunit